MRLALVVFVLLASGAAACEEECSEEGGKCIYPLPDNGDGCGEENYHMDFECDDEDKICCLPEE